MKIHRLNGFSLLEAAIATGVTAFCLLTLFGLLPIGLNQSNETLAQSTAANLASMLNSDLRATPMTAAPISPLYGFTLPAAGNTSTLPQSIFFNELGAFTKVDDHPAGNELFRATVWFSAPQQTHLRNATAVRILITWPASSDRDPAKPPVRFSGSFEAITALNRN